MEQGKYIKLPDYPRTWIFVPEGKDPGERVKRYLDRLQESIQRLKTNDRHKSKQK